MNYEDPSLLATFALCVFWVCLLGVIVLETIAKRRDWK